MCEVRIHEDVFARLRNEVLCATHTLRALREAGIPAVGTIALVGVQTGTLQTWRDGSGLDGDEFVFAHDPQGQLPNDSHQFRFHEDDLGEKANPFAFNNFVERMRKVVPMCSTLSPHALEEGVLTMYRDETLDGDEYVFSWTADEL